MGGGLSRLPLFLTLSEQEAIVKNIKFVVKVKRGGTGTVEYVQRIDRSPVQMTTNRKRALLMGRFTAEDAVKSIQNSGRIPQLVPVRIDA